MSKTDMMTGEVPYLEGGGLEWFRSWKMRRKHFREQMLTLPAI